MDINLSKTEEQLTAEVMSKINLSKDKEEFENKVINLSKSIINLSKSSGVDLGNVKAQVVVVLDYSGSMRNLYYDGVVQRVINRMLPLGLTFDDNGEVEVFRFADGNSYEQFKSLNIKNYSDYIEKNVFHGEMGGTDYAPVLNEIKKQYIDGVSEAETKKGFFSRLFKKSKSTELKTMTGADATVNPVFVIFITDGDNFDKNETNSVIRELSKACCFIQFIGVGDSSMSYLEQLDELDDREYDNTGFKRFSNIEDVGDLELYDEVLKQFADWLKAKGF